MVSPASEQPGYRSICRKCEAVNGDIEYSGLDKGSRV